MKSYFFEKKLMVKEIKIESFLYIYFCIEFVKELRD